MHIPAFLRYYSMSSTVRSRVDAGEQAGGDGGGGGGDDRWGPEPVWLRLGPGKGGADSGLLPRKSRGLEAKIVAIFGFFLVSLVFGMALNSKAAGGGCGCIESKFCSIGKIRPRNLIKQLKEKICILNGGMLFFSVTLLWLFQCMYWISSLICVSSTWVSLHRVPHIKETESNTGGGRWRRSPKGD